MEIEFKPEVEIIRIWGTCNDDHVQIIAKDVFRNLVMIITWDIIKNMEVNMFQITCESGTNPENYIVRGMDLKYNYFISQHQLFDLEYNLPMQAVQNNTLKRDPGFVKENNQRKVFIDGSRMLSIENKNKLSFPACRMDLLFWKNINDLGEKPALIN